MKIIPPLLLIFFSIQANAQSPSDNTDLNTPDSVSNFQPSLAVVIGMLAIMFSLTFVLLLYAKFCHRAASVHSHQIHDGLPRSRSLAAGVDKTVVESLPFFRFSYLRGSRDGLECAVCLAKFEDVDILRLLPKCKHAFHIDCIDQWLEKHSTCPLCRRKVSADDLSQLQFSTSLRFLCNPELGRQDSNLELYVEREESRHGSSRFCIGGSFRKMEEEEEAPIPESMDCDSSPPPPLHRFNHKILVADAVLKNRWSNVSSSDIMFLNSEMMSSAAEAITSIKEEMERKRALESKVREINQASRGDDRNILETDSNRRKLGFESNDKRSMSEIVVHPRFTELRRKDSSSEEINVKEETTRRLWLSIARKTVQWFANRERRSPQPQELRLNI
ncbi:E3 ubiquitin-protein ligase ATL42 [Salvia miltiorrhiza]|uniref:E3 ubiquitin-protein ligase ATL42 n=1 Tax=Salvia miltiorrhiza TaxID=226208 RepID=UPI0025AC038B|nr:E3 ubiquitin-protein ligase ATL42 [Salvia miltiorrhiza]